MEDYKWEGLRILDRSSDVTLLVDKATQKKGTGGRPVPTSTCISSLWMKQSGNDFSVSRERGKVIPSSLRCAQWLNPVFETRASELVLQSILGDLPVAGEIE